jgi:hypothetical protein
MRVGPGSGTFRVIEAETVTRLVESEIEKDVRIKEIWNGLKWLIARSGHLIGVEIKFQGKNHRIYKTAPTEAGIPSIRVVYFHDVDQFLIKIVSISSDI